MQVMLLERITEAKFVQFLKAWSFKVVTLSGIEMDVNPVQLTKADCPMEVTLSGIVMEVIFEQP